jgi:hypothetical protein
MCQHRMPDPIPSVLTQNIHPPHLGGDAIDFPQCATANCLLITVGDNINVSRPYPSICRPWSIRWKDVIIQPTHFDGRLAKERQRDFSLGIDFNEAKVHVLLNSADLLPFAGMQV